MSVFAVRFSRVVSLICLGCVTAGVFARAETSKTLENYRLHMFDAPFRSLATVSSVLAEEQETVLERTAAEVTQLKART